MSLSLGGRARYLCAFWVSQQPGYLAYAMLDTRKNLKWELIVAKITSGSLSEALVVTNQLCM